MSMSDAAVEAKEAAARELAKLLPTPEMLINLAALRAEYAHRQQANDAQLSTSVTTQVEQARAGIEALAAAQATIAELRQNINTIEELCKECDALIENDQQIKQLSIVRNNLNTTLKDAEGMLSISTEAAEARELLSDDRELVKTYERLTALERKKRFALAAASSRPEEAGKLREYFEDVSRTKETFERTLWGYIRDFFRLAKESPQTLVRALRVVEMQEIWDQQAAEEAEGKEGGGQMDMSSAPMPAREGPSYKDRCYEEIQLAVDDRFNDLLNKLVYEDLKAALEEALSIIDDLPDVHKYVAPCFPPRYEIFQLVVQLYAQHFVQMLQRLSDRASELSNMDILKVVQWLNVCADRMVQMGVEDTVAMMVVESGELDPLMDQYVKEMTKQLKVWLKNLIDRDFEEPPKPAKSTLYTPMPVDVFQLLGAQMNTVQEHSNALMLFKAAQALITVVMDFQELERTHLEEMTLDIQSPNVLETLCAAVNNNVRCHDLLVELSNPILEGLEPRFAEQLNFQEACTGFLEVTKLAVQKTVDSIFADPGVVDLMAKLYMQDWIDAMVTEYLCATFEDYRQDICVWLEEKAFRRFAESLLDKTMIVYVDQLLLSKQYITDATIERMKVDEELIVECFQKDIAQTKLEKKLLPLVEIRDLAAADSLESFTLVYSELIKNHPDCPPEVVEKIVSLREGIPKKDAREVVQSCREQYELLVSQKGPPKAGPVFTQLSALITPQQKKFF